MNEVLRIQCLAKSKQNVSIQRCSNGFWQQVKQKFKSLCTYAADILVQGSADTNVIHLKRKKGQARLQTISRKLLIKSKSLRSNAGICIKTLFLITRGRVTMCPLQHLTLHAVRKRESQMRRLIPLHGLF